MAGLSIEVDVPRSIIINYDENFNEREDYKLNELFQVLKFMKIKQNKNSKVLNSMDLLEVIRAGALYYENEGMRLVNVVKQMTAFNSIDHNDRLALVKYSGVEVIIFRSIQCYDDKQRHWRFPMVIRCNSLDISLHIVYTENNTIITMNVNILKQFSQGGYALYMNNWNSIMKECESDPVIIDLVIINS